MNEIIPNNIQLSKIAMRDFKKVVQENVGVEIDNISDEDLHHMALFVLGVAALTVSVRMRMLEGS